MPSVSNKKAFMNPQLFNDFTINASRASFFSPDFNQVLDSHMEYLRTAGGVRTAVIPTETRGLFIGDFYALLIEMNIDPKYHRFIMMLNGFTSPTKYDNQLNSLIIPDLSLIDKLLTVYQTGRRSLSPLDGE